MQADSQPRQQFRLEHSMNAVLSSSRKLELRIHDRRCDYRLIMWSEYTLGSRTYAGATANALGILPTKSECLRLQWHVGRRPWQVVIQGMNQHQRFPPQPVDALSSLPS